MEQIYQHFINSGLSPDQAMANAEAAANALPLPYDIPNYTAPGQVDTFGDTAVEMMREPWAQAKEDWSRVQPGSGFDGLGAAGSAGLNALTALGGGGAGLLSEIVPDIGGRGADNNELAFARDFLGFGDAFAGGGIGRGVNMLDDLIDAGTDGAQYAGRGAADLARRIEIDPNAVGSMGGNVRLRPQTDAPFDMQRGVGDNGGPSMRVGYSRSGEDIAKSLADTPSARSVLLGDDSPIGSGFSNIKSLGARALPEHTSTGYLSDETLPPVSNASIAGLLDRDVMAIVGDQTGRHTVTGVMGEALPEPVESLAGFQYIDVPGQGYAGAQSATSSKLNAAANAQDPYYMSLMMGEKSGDFSRHEGNIFGQMFRTAPISKGDTPKIDAAIRSIGVPKVVKVLDDAGNVVKKANGDPKTRSVTTYPFTDFSSVENPTAVLDYINALPTGTQRAYFLKGMDKHGLQKMGVPRVSDARLAAADETQIGMDWGTVGYRGFTPDVERGLHPTTSAQSTTYDTGIGKVGRADTYLDGSRGIPANLLYRDLAEAQRAKGTGGGLLMNSADYKVYEASPAKAMQRIDNMAVETIDTFLEIERRHGREAALQYGGSLLSGGRITSDLIKAAKKANAPSWMIAALAPSAGLLSQMPPQEEQY
tara:strand:+ start:35 stop:1981 length:1947 start_codon:yes stop_codon:yes gene_type:complete